MEAQLIKLLSKKTSEEKTILRGGEIDKSLYSFGEDFVVNERRLHTDAQKVSVRTHTRYTPFPEHKHSYVEMMLVLKGSITHRISGETITVRAGEIIILNRHTSHSIDSADTGDIGVNVIMSDSFSESVARDLSENVFSPFFNEHRKKDGLPMYLHFTTGKDKRLSNLIENLLFELTDECPSDGVMSRTLSLLLTCLSRSSESLLLGGEIATDKNATRASEIISYVKESYRTATLVELSHKLYLSSPYLSKLTVELFGKSFKELLIEERMTRAKQLLLSTKLSVGDVIRAVGYENESYFHREFKKRHGKTPLEVRNSGRS